MSLQHRIKLSFKPCPVTSAVSPCCVVADVPGSCGAPTSPSSEAVAPKKLGSSADDAPPTPSVTVPKLKFYFSNSPTIKPRDHSLSGLPLSRDGSSSDVSSPRLKSSTPRKGSYDIDDFVMPLGWGSPRVQVEEEVKPKDIFIPHARRPAWLPCIPQASVGGKRYRGSSIHQDLSVPRPDESSGEEVSAVKLLYQYMSDFSFFQDISDSAFIQRHSRLEFMEHNHRLTVASKKKKKDEENEQPADSPLKASLLSCSFNTGTRCSSPSASESGTPRSTRRMASSSTR
jgi:hypothetical protein